jgi:hypothetical protein
MNKQMTERYSPRTIIWKRQTRLIASQLLKPPLDEEEKSALDEAKEFLVDQLKDGHL